jgi:hypothetical protein
VPDRRQLRTARNGKDYGPIQFADFLSLRAWQLSRAHEYGLIPGPARPRYRWSADLDQVPIDKVTRYIPKPARHVGGRYIPGGNRMTGTERPGGDPGTRRVGSRRLVRGMRRSHPGRGEGPRCPAARMAINHSKISVASHTANFPHVDHCCDDVRRIREAEPGTEKTLLMPP